MRTIAGAVLFWVFLSAGCHSSSSPVRERELRINLGQNPATLDPAKARDLNTLTLLRMLFEGLTRLSKEEKPELALAKEVSLSQDLKRYTFTLKESFWSEGTPLTAYDFVYAWRRALSPAFPSDYAAQLYVIKNGRAVKEGKLLQEELGVKALDERTLQVDLERPAPYFLELLSFPIFFPLLQSRQESYSRFVDHEDSLVGNGPFCLKRWKQDDSLLIEKNERYWDSKSVKLKRVFFVMVDSETELALFEKGELDWAGSPLSSLPIDALKELQKRGRVKQKTFCATSFVRLQTQKGPLAIPAFRRALSLAVNRKEIVEHVTCGGQLPSTTLVPPSFRLHPRELFEDGATAQAKELFKESQVRLTRPLTFLYCNGTRNHLIAQALQEQWRKALGVLVRLEAAERKIFFSRLSQGDFELALGDWVADFHDPVNFLEILKTKDAGTNRTGWENALYTEMLERSFSIAASKERFSLLAEAEKILLDEMPLIPLNQAAMLYLHQDKIKGVSISSMGNMELKWAYFDE